MLSPHFLPKFLRAIIPVELPYAVNVGDAYRQVHYKYGTSRSHDNSLSRKIPNFKPTAIQTFQSHKYHYLFITMVSFRTLLTSALALTPVVAQTQVTKITSSKVVFNIELLTNKSLALQAPANQIDLLSGPLIIIGQGPFPVCHSCAWRFGVTTLRSRRWIHASARLRAHNCMDLTL